jgi:hypothetical protein
MTTRELVRAGGIVGVCTATVLASALYLAPRLQAHDDDRDGDEAKIRRGFEIAPVHLDLAHKNRALVGLGSYIVNAQGECNGCHSAGPTTQFLPGGNPYFGQPEKVNPATYLGGGRDFGPYPFPTSTLHIFSRNLTPDHTGLPIGGDTFQEFRNTIRTGVDPDQLHPNLPPPFNGSLLQIMPWPAYRHMTDRDLRAIYEYLSAIPCVAGPGHVC